MKDWYLKDRLILNILRYIDNNTEQLKQAIIEDLKSLADNYHVKVKKTAKIDLKAALYEFLENKQGMQIHLSKIYYSL
jgi:hypothetical protein